LRCCRVCPGGVFRCGLLDGDGVVWRDGSDGRVRCGDLLAVAAIAPEGENEGHEQQSDSEFFPRNGRGLLAGVVG